MMIICFHCKREVADESDVETLRAHSVSCDENPLVLEFASLKRRLAELERKVEELKPPRRPPGVY